MAICFARTRCLALLLLPLLLAGGCATNPATGGTDLVFMSEKQEVELGKRMHPQILQQYGVYNDTELQNYVQYVGRRVAEKSDRTALAYQFTVLDSPDVNAFALPGGYIYITRGLMAYLNSEAELAAVLGHEIGHVTARHAVRQHSATQLTSIGAGLGAAIGSAFVPGLGQASQQLAGVLGTALLRGYGRDHELEADRLGAEYIARSGYDPQAMMSVIRALKNQELYEIKAARTEGREPRVYHGLFSTHPDNDTRLKEAVAGASSVTAVSNPFIGHEDYLQRTNGMVYGENSGQGMLRGRDFYHGDLGFAVRFPQGWKVANLPDKVVSGTPDGAALLQLSIVPMDPSLSPGQLLSQRLGVRQVNNAQDLRINGLPAHTANAVVPTAEGERIARITVIYLDNRAYVIAGLTRDAGAIGRYDETFLAAARTFRPLTAGERKVAGQVQRLSLVRANRKTTFAALAEASALEKLKEEQVRLVNGRYPRGEITPGEWLKTVQ